MVEKLIPVVVLGLGVNGLGVIRSLGEKGIPIIGVYDTIDEKIGKFSRYCKERIYFEDITPKNIIDLLDKCVKKASGPIIIYPTADYYLRVILNIPHNKNWLFVSPSKEILKIFLDKYKTAKYLNESGISTPSTWCFKNVDEILEKKNELIFPLIIKPRYSGDINNNIKFKTSYFNELAELICFLSRTPNVKLNNLVFQQAVPAGDGYVIDAVSVSGKNLSTDNIHTTTKIRQYPSDFGVCCFGMSKNNTKIKETTLELINKIHYDGILNAEFIINNQNGRIYLIEVNARPMYYNSFQKETGMDFIYYAYCERLGINYHRGRQIYNRYWLDFIKDLGSYKQKKSMTFVKWILSLRKTSFYSIWNFKDPLPWCIKTINFLKYIIKSIIRNSTEEIKK